MVAMIVGICAMLHHVTLRQNLPLVPIREEHDPYSVVASREEKATGAAQDQHGITILEDVLRQYVTQG